MALVGVKRTEISTTVATTEAPLSSTPSTTVATTEAPSTPSTTVATAEATSTPTTDATGQTPSASGSIDREECPLCNFKVKQLSVHLKGTHHVEDSNQRLAMMADQRRKTRQLSLNIDRSQMLKELGSLGEKKCYTGEGIYSLAMFEQFLAKIGHKITEDCDMPEPVERKSQHQAGKTTNNPQIEHEFTQMAASLAVQSALQSAAMPPSVSQETSSTVMDAGSLIEMDAGSLLEVPVESSPTPITSFPSDPLSETPSKRFCNSDHKLH